MNNPDIIYRFGYDDDGDEVYLSMDQDEELQDNQLYALQNGEWIILGKQLKLLRGYTNEYTK